MHQVRVATIRPISIAVLLLALLPGARAGLAQDHGAAIQDQGASIIEGAVYDPREALIVGAWISIENMETGEFRNLRTDESGRYRASLQKGRYRVTMLAHPGYPFGYEHSSFLISSGEKVTINFRPKPFGISSSIEGGNWIERYHGDFLTSTTHLIQRPNGAIRDLRIQSDQLRTRGQTFEYRFWVTASFDRLTLHADKAVFGFCAVHSS